ncbi:hypothetical protein BMETH_866_0 [methanotrophic bacterial endosymbiont of Bathymodiolus sp.]|jgi:hypothetical protein|nr:hypothetical protein BMETH_866_0 [methanotrophic bacterial endosymbiont of Bathymodiolus sp.]
MQKAKINGGLWKSRIKRSDNTMAAINGLSRRASRSFLSIVPPGFLTHLPRAWELEVSDKS